MEIAGMESVVNCPKCGECVPVFLRPYQDLMGGLMKKIEGSIGVEETSHFEGGNKCKCGKTVMATLHVTATTMETSNGKN